MADIDNPVQYTQPVLDMISTKLNDPSFLHNHWGNEDLEVIRKEIRDHYRETQNGICVYCKNEVSLISALNCHVEHIAPKSLYKKFIFEPKNLCVVCADCNSIKREQEVHKACENTFNKETTMYPRSSGAFKVYHPHFDNWNEHIICFNGIYADLTDKGANTIRICRLNRRLRTFGVDDRFIAHPEVLHVANTLLQHGNIDEVKKLMNL
ncbi:HNH endonuclease [Providencia rettgeri]